MRRNTAFSQLICEVTAPFNSIANHFGFSSFRPGQEGAIRSLLEDHHTLTIMPMGAGKSLIFQLATIMLGAGFASAPITLVISPLIALPAPRWGIR